MPSCIFRYSLTNNFTGHEGHPVRVYNERPYEYWGERPVDHPIPKAIAEWEGELTKSIELAPGRYWAVLLYFPETNRPLYSCDEFEVSGESMEIPISKKSHYLKSQVLGPDHGAPACPITCFCCENILPDDVPTIGNKNINMKINEVESDHLSQRYQSSIRPRVGCEPAYSTISVTVPPGTHQISFVQHTPDFKFLRFWQKRNIVLERNKGCHVRLLGWDYLSNPMNGDIPDSGAPGPRGMEIWYIDMNQ